LPSPAPAQPAAQPQPGALPQPGQPQPAAGGDADLPTPDAMVAGPAAGVGSDPSNAIKPPRIKYDTDSDARHMYACFGTTNVIMITQNPADNCYYEIPLCLPGCVAGEPSVNAYCGIMGRGVVRYCYPGGFEVIVKFRELIGDVRVDYEGD
jgi:hypothetical protein